MPATDVSLLLRAADRLEAIERLGAIQDRIAGSGMVKESSAKAHLRYLEDKARSGSPEESRGSSRGSGGLSALRAAGVAVRVVKRAAHG